MEGGNKTLLRSGVTVTADGPVSWSEFESRYIHKLTIDEQLYELKQRLNWFISGIGRHGITWNQFKYLTAEWIVKHYNVEMTYFRKDGNSN